MFFQYHLILIGWEKYKSFFTNVKNMRFFCMEFISKLLMLISTFIIEYIFISYNFFNVFQDMNMDWIYILLMVNFSISIYIFYISLRKIFLIEETSVFLKEKMHYFIVMFFDYLSPPIIIILLINILA